MEGNNPALVSEEAAHSDVEDNSGSRHQTEVNDNTSIAASDNSCDSRGSDTNHRVDSNIPDTNSVENNDSNCKDNEDKKTKRNNSFTRKQKIILISAFIGQFFSNACASLPAPFLPKLNEQHNINSDLTGWILGLFSLVQLFVCTLSGRLLSKIGIHTAVVFGLFFCGGVTAVFGLLEYATLPDSEDDTIDVTYLILAIVLRIGQAIGSGVYITASMTMLSITFPENTIAVMGYSETIIGLGFMSGPAIGSGLFKLGGFMLTFGGLGGTMVVASAALWFILPFRIQATDGEEEEQGSMWKIFSNINIVLSLILATNSAVMWASLDPVLEPELRNKYGLSQEVSALIFLILTIAYTITATIIAKVLDKFRNVETLYILMFGFLLCGVNFLFMGPTPLIPALQRPLWLLLVTIAMLGISLGFALVPSLNLSFGQSDENGKAYSTSTTAMISGLWSGAYAFGDFLGPTVSGVITENADFGWAMTSFAFLCFVCVLMTFIVKMCKLKKKPSKKSLNINTVIVNEALSDDDVEPLIP